ncbi:bifunctional phosphopantothenoylcysteine decarboxylase/phosphopantothenate--cysteine ligase CoaBC [Bacteroidota bacterium]
MLKNKKIILGITGSIAAYKAAHLIRLFVKEGAEVKVVITPYGKEFISPVTLATLSKNTVLCDFFKYDDGAWNSHVDLGLWADLMIIAPATANTIAKMAHGIADNLLLTTYLSARCKVMLAPAMDMDMLAHPATIKNFKIIKEYGNIIIDPSGGELASGLEGKGRMEDPEKIILAAKNYFAENETLSGKKFLVNAGPTYEKIDPVRYIGNFSSGKMGYAIAEELAERGAEVTLVSGPVSICLNQNNISIDKVISAEEMFEKCLSIFPKMDGAILTAAVADYKPLEVSKSKIKRKKDNLNIELEPTNDIASALGKIKTDKQLLIGFALETENELKNAMAKIEKKKLDFIVLNSLKNEGAGFQTDTNKICIIDKDNITEEFELKSKNEVARDIINKLEQLI